MKQYKLAVIIGRMQFLHNGHIHLFNEAAKKADQILVLVGSSDKAPSPSNPFTYQQREQIVFGALHEAGITQALNSRVNVMPLPDDYLEDQWMANVINAVQTHAEAQLGETGMFIKDEDVVLVGHEKDASSYYLRMFPQWDFYNAPNDRGLNATDFRKELFDRLPARDPQFIAKLLKLTEPLSKFESAAFCQDVVSLLVEHYPELNQHLGLKPSGDLRPLDMTHLKLNSPKAMHPFLEEYIRSEEYMNMVAENRQYADEKLSWGMAPYPVTFVTTDAVVTHKSSILMIRRKNHPGKGLWALPGGFLGAKEWVRDSIIRELREETRIAVANEDLLRIMQPVRVFDNPGRSLRGRVITHAARFNLDHLGLTKRPKVRADDDAEAVRWFSFGEILKADKSLFEDHAEIIRRLVFSRG